MNTRKHFFRDENDNRTVVVTSMTPRGLFRAVITEADGDEMNYIAFGFGHSRLAAIADLNASIQMSREEV
jgi:hypothetical protein